MRKITALVLTALLMFALVSCQDTPAAPAAPVTPSITAPAASAMDKPDMGLIGIAMPSKNNTYRRWERDGQYIKKQLETKGYTVELTYAEDYYQETQNSQIKELIASGCSVLVIAAIDGGGLGTVLAEAKVAGVTVIAYVFDMWDTKHEDYFVTFDYFRYGALQGEYVEDKLGLKEGKGPFNIEVFAGDRGDANMMFYFEGGMSILRPYIENGQLVVKSGQTDWMDAYTDLYKSENAKVRMDSFLAEYYTSDKLDAVFALTDSIAMGVINSLEDAGYTEFPLITGMGCDKLNVIAIKAGKQSMSLFPDRHILTTKVVEMVDDVVTGREVPLTAVTEHISNGITFTMSTDGVPTFLCDPYVVTVDNIQKILIDSGYYTEAELGG